ncbi:MAG: hypothetical protein ACRCV3_02835 [Desulfovibrionaceae bacterium]
MSQKVLINPDWGKSFCCIVAIERTIVEIDGIRMSRRVYYLSQRTSWMTLLLSICRIVFSVSREEKAIGRYKRQ